MEQQLPELLQGTLERPREQMVLEHLAQCEHCRAELAFWAQLAAMERQAAQKPPRQVIDDVADRLGLRQPVTLRDTFDTVRSALQLTNSAVRLAFSLAQR
jgi:predicted anti-sigma-YlaC factor YlaD